MKKPICMLLAVFMLVLSLGGTCFAANDVDVSVVAPASVEIGAEFTVEIKATASDMAGGKVILLYDNTLLNVKSAVKGADFLASPTINTAYQSTNKVFMNAASTTATLPSGGTMLVITFEAKAAGTANFSFDQVQFRDTNVAVLTVGTTGAATTITKPKYSLNFDTKGGSAIPAMSCESGEAITLPEAPTKTDSQNKVTYSFEGWYTDDACETPFTASAGITAATTIYAKWNVTPIQHQITFNSLGGTDVSPMTVNAGTAITLPEAPTKAATATTTYSFAGWYTDDTFTTALDTAAGIYEATTVYAKWLENAIEYDLTFVTNGGTAVNAMKVVAGEAITLPAAPTKDGGEGAEIAFAGWYLDNDTFANRFDPEAGILEDTTVYAKWAEAYAVTFWTDVEDAEGNVEFNVQKVGKGGAATAPETTPTKESSAEFDYSFKSWSVAFDNITEALDVYPIFEKTTRKYTITWAVEGAEPTTTQVEYGTVPTAPAEDPTKASTVKHTFTFAGWDPALEAVSGATTYTAKFDEALRKYSVSYYDVDGTTKLGSAELEYGSKVADTKIEETVTVEDGYKFYQWVDSEGNPVTEVSGELSLTATTRKKSSGVAATGVIRPAPGGAGTPSVKPDDTKPEDTKPEDTKPEDTKPEDTKPEDTKPEDTKPDATSKFTDVTSAYDWAKDSINTLAEIGIINGRGDGNFDPAGTITRAEIAKMLVLITNAEADTTSVELSDVTDDAWYAEYVRKLAALGVMSGYEDGAFRPEQQVTREETAKLIAKALGAEKLAAMEKGEAADFADASGISDWAKDSIDSLAKAGLIRGDEAGNYNPASSLTRAEAAVLFTRILASL